MPYIKPTLNACRHISQHVLMSSSADPVTWLIMVSEGECAQCDIVSQPYNKHALYNRDFVADCRSERRGGGSVHWSAVSMPVRRWMGRCGGGDASHWHGELLRSKPLRYASQWEPQIFFTGISFGRTRKSNRARNFHTPVRWIATTVWPYGSTFSIHFPVE